MTSEFTIAVHAMVYLNHKNQVLDSESLAENVCTNPVRIRRVMAKLKKAGFVATKEGAGGGYSMVKSADEIDLCSIGEALEVDFVKASWKSGNPEMDCLVSSGMASVMDGIYAELDRLCRERLKKITISHIDKEIFKEKRGE